jgi:hypothetical protein
LVSLLLHLPVSPLVSLLGLVHLLGEPPVPPPADPNESTAIPIELLGQTAPAAESPTPAEPVEAEPPSTRHSEPKAPNLQLGERNQPPVPPRDAGLDAPDAGEQVDASESADAGSPEGSDGGDADGGDAGGGPSPLRNPVALAGVAGSIADSNAPVSVAVYTQNIRRHPLGARVGQLLARVYQWRDFFGPAGLDPVQDIDRMLIAGPEFHDSSRVVAVLRHRISETRMKAAVDRMVKAYPGGKWLGGKMPLAAATADRAPRLLALPAPHLVVIAPPSARKSVLGLAKALSRKREAFPGPRGDELLVAYVVTPWAALAKARVPLRVPESIKSATLVLSPSPDGGVLARVQAEDESAESARKHADELTVAVRAAARIGRGILRFSAIERVAFWADGNVIHGEAYATADQVALAVAFVAPMLMPADESWSVPSAMPPPAASLPQAVDSQPDDSARLGRRRADAATSAASSGSAYVPVTPTSVPSATSGPRKESGGAPASP